MTDDQRKTVAFLADGAVWGDEASTHALKLIDELCCTRAAIDARDTAFRAWLAHQLSLTLDILERCALDGMPRAYADARIVETSIRAVLAEWDRRAAVTAPVTPV